MYEEYDLVEEPEQPEQPEQPDTGTEPEQPEQPENGGKIDWKQKLSSRKLWAAVVGVVVGLAAAFGLTENDWAQVAGIVTAAASVAAYIFGEAKIDAAHKDEAVEPSGETEPKA